MDMTYPQWHLFAKDEAILFMYFRVTKVVEDHGSEFSG